MAPDVLDTLPCVFVYGTLMPGGRNEHVARRGGRFVAEPAVLPGHALHDLRPENYPCVVPGDPHDEVHGALLTFEDWDRARPHLDRLEGLHLAPPLYRRKRATVRTAAGERAAWVYVYARPERLGLPGAARVPDGRWDGAGRSRPAPDLP